MKQAVADTTAGNGPGREESIDRSDDGKSGKHARWAMLLKGAFVNQAMMAIELESTPYTQPRTKQTSLPSDEILIDILLGK